MDLNSLRKNRQASLSLQPVQKAGMRMALHPFLMRGGLQGSPFNVRRQAASALRSQFPQSSPSEIELLTSCFLTRVAAAMVKQRGADFKGTKTMSYEEARGQRDALKDTKDSMEDMNDQDMFYLRQAMDQKSQLESMISNMMKAAADAQTTLVGNLKG